MRTGFLTSILFFAAMAFGVSSQAAQKSEFLSSSRFHSCAYKNGQLKCWGSNAFGQTDVPEQLKKDPIRGLFTSSYGSCVITSKKTLACWGAVTDLYLPYFYFDQLLSFAKPLKNIDHVAMTDRSLCMSSGRKVRCLGMCRIEEGKPSDCAVNLTLAFTPNRTMAKIFWDTTIWFADEKGNYLALEDRPKLKDNRFRKLEWYKAARLYGVEDLPLHAAQLYSCHRGIDYASYPTTEVICSEAFWNSWPRRLTLPYSEFSSLDAVTVREGSVCGIKSGALECLIGKNPKMKLEKPTLISSGVDFTCVMDAEGVKCWGDNRNAQAPSLVTFE